MTPYPTVLGTTRPASVRDLLEHLHDVASLSAHEDSPANGTVEIQTITDADGSVRHVLYLPGTDDFNAPWDQDSDVRDLETDLGSMAGRPDAYQQGILEALDQAGVGQGEPVLIVGHSLGGIEAAAILAGHGGHHVTDVVTAGSPTAQVPGFPSGSHVLSLEQQGDIVPELDGAPNPSRRADHGGLRRPSRRRGPGPPLLRRLRGGRRAGRRGHGPSVADAVQSLEDHGFLGGGGQVTSQVFQITRAP